MTKDSKQTDFGYIDKMVRDKLKDYRATTNLTWQDVQSRIKVMPKNRVSSIKLSGLKIIITSVVVSAGVITFLSLSKRATNYIREGYNEIVSIDTIRKADIDTMLNSQYQVISFQSRKYQNHNKTKEPDTLVKVTFEVDTTFE